MNKIHIPSKVRFLLIGSGDLAKYILRQLPEYFDDVVLITTHSLDSAWSIWDKQPITEVAAEMGISCMDTEDYDKAFNYAKTETRNVCLTIGSKWIFKKDFLDIFNGAIFNYHPANLPDYRGGGGFSWQIMNGLTTTYATIHQMTSKVDGGPIFIKKKKSLDENPIPADFHSGTIDLAKEVVIEFLKTVEDNQGSYINVKEQGDATYFPLLNSKINAAIDFRWDREEISSFIRAFSDPYEGAFTYCKGKQLRIMEVVEEEWDWGFNQHPFCSGVIARIYDNGDIGVFCNNGILRIHKWKYDGKLRLGDRLWTPEKELEKARTHRPSNKDFTLKVDKGKT